MMAEAVRKCLADAVFAWMVCRGRNSSAIAHRKRRRREVGQNPDRDGQKSDTVASPLWGRCISVLEALTAPEVEARAWNAEVAEIYEQSAAIEVAEDWRAQKYRDAVAPGGPADPNGTSGSPPPGDRWINGLPPDQRRLGAEGERAARVGCLPPPIPPVRESLMRVGGAPAGVIHSLPQWSSGRVAQSGLEGGIVRSLRHRGVARARLARDECPADARTQSPPGAG
jgi:hypothetical protein